MSHSFLPEAEAEYLLAIRFYEEHRAGLGSALVSEFERAVHLDIERPQTWKLVHVSGLRRFPFAVFFRTLPDGVVQITAFAHHRQRPGYWFARAGV